MNKRWIKIFLTVFITLSLLLQSTAFAKSYSGSKSSSKSSVKSTSHSVSKPSSGSSTRSTPSSYSKSTSTTSKSSGYTGSSTSKSGTQSSSTSSQSNTSNSSTVNTNTTSSKYTGSSTSSGGTTRSIPSKSSSTAVNSKKIAYMEDAYKKEISKTNYSKYKNQLNSDQQKAYDDSINRTYSTPSNRMNLEDALSTRTQRMGRYSSFPVIVNVNTSMFPGHIGYGSSYIGPFDLWFLMRASDMFWYHHWDLISPYRSYFDPVGFAAREAMIRQMQTQNILRDPSYMDPDWDYDLAYSPEYQEGRLGSLYDTRKTVYQSPLAGVMSFIIIIVIIIIILLIIKNVSKSRHRDIPKFRSNKNIY